MRQVRCARPRGLIPRAVVSEHRSIFQLQPPIGQPSMLEVREAYEACALHADEEGRQQCYALFGLDGERMDRYYHVVSELECTYQIGEDAPKDAPEESPLASAWASFRLMASFCLAFLGFVVALCAGMLAGLFAMKPTTRQQELAHK